MTWIRTGFCCTAQAIQRWNEEVQLHFLIKKTCLDNWLVHCQEVDYESICMVTLKLSITDSSPTSSMSEYGAPLFTYSIELCLLLFGQTYHIFPLGARTFILYK